MTRILAVAAIALSMAACSSTDGWGHKSSRSSSDNDNATAMNTRDNMQENNGSNGANDRSQQYGQKGNLAEQDRRFVGKASEGGLYEVQSSQLALQKTQDAHVRMIAQHMIHDHTQANQQLMQLAQREGLQAESQPSQEQQQMIQELRGLNGTDFDQKYISQQTQAHKETIALFQQEANSGQDSGLRSFAAQTLPTLQEHLRMIQGNNNNNMSNERQ